MIVSQSTSSSMLSAAFTTLNGGSIVVYSGTQPSTPETAPSGNTELFSIPLNNPALSGSITYNSGFMVGNLSFAASAVNPVVTSGVAVWARAYESGVSPGGSGSLDLTAGTSGTDIILGTTTIVSGTTITIQSGTLSNPAS